jgi:hypothetical protein
VARIVDLRPHSPSRGAVDEIVLSGREFVRMPPGCAHSFQAQLGAAGRSSRSLAGGNGVERYPRATRRRTSVREIATAKSARRQSKPVSAHGRRCRRGLRREAVVQANLRPLYPLM